MEQTIFIILGWLLGVLSPSLTDRISHHYKKDALQRIIISELKDLKKRLAFIPFLVNPKYGTLNKELVVWTKEQTQDCVGFEFNDTLKKNFAKLNFKNDADLTQLINLYNSVSQDDEPAFHFKKLETSVIDSNFMNIGILDSEFITKVLEIKFQINALNQEIQSVDEHLKMTFDSNITNNNHQIIKMIIKNKNLLISKKAIYIVEKINLIITKKLQ